MKFLKSLLSKKGVALQKRRVECGRSMVEMLVVLAIVGTLSIGGIVGYEQAMIQYQTNETANELNSRIILYSQRLMFDAPPPGATLLNVDYGLKTLLGYDISANVSLKGNSFEMTLSDYPQKVCRQLLEKYVWAPKIIVGEKVFDKNAKNVDICGNGSEAPNTVFIFANDLNVNIENTSPYPDYPTDPDRCVPESKKTFSSAGKCYECDDKAAYRIANQEDYDSCLACGRHDVAGQCAPVCSAGEIWHIEQQQCVKPSCSNNSNCDVGHYCRLDSSATGASCSVASLTGTCTKSDKKVVTIEGVGRFAESLDLMDWWSAQSFCDDVDGTLVSLDVFQCGYDYKESKNNGWCNTDENRTSAGKRSDVMSAFQKVLSTDNKHWLQESYPTSPECNARVVSFDGGQISRGTRDSQYHALCRLK